MSAPCEPLQDLLNHDKVYICEPVVWKGSAQQDALYNKSGSSCDDLSCIFFKAGMFRCHIMTVLSDL